MNLFLSELRKLFGNVKILAVLLAAMVVNVVLLIIPEFGEYSPSAYNALWSRLDALPESQHAEFLEERIADRNDPRWFTSGAECEFADNFTAEQELLRDVYAEIAQVDGYGEYLESTDQAAENMKNVSFFANKDSFSYRNIIRTQSDFVSLGTDNVSYGRSKGILLAARFGMTDIIVLLLVMMFGVKLLLSERESGFMPLLRSTANGKFTLAAAKFAALVTAAMGAAMALYGSGIATGASLYGFGDMGRAFRSVYGYFTCGTTITVADFFVLFSLVKLLFCMVISAVVFVVFSLPFGSAASFGILGGFTAAEAALYFFIPASSVFSPFKQINITALANTVSLLGKYLNINVFHQPVSAVPITIASSVVLIVICSVGGIFAFTTAGERRTSGTRGILGGRHTNIVPHELYKCFFSGKGILILITAVLMVLALQKPIKPYYDNIEEYFYYMYISQLEGEVTEEKEEYIASEIEKANMDFSDEGIYKRSALSKLSAHTEYLKQNGGHFVADKGYRLLSGDESVRIYDRLAAAVKAMVLILIAAFSYSAEYRFGGDILMRSTPNGRARTLTVKLLCAAISALAVLAIFDGSRIYNVLNAWGARSIFAPALSMEHLSHFSGSIVSCIALTELARFGGALLMSSGVFFISTRLKNYSATVICSVTVFVVPLILSAFGFRFLDFFLLNPFLIGTGIG